MAAPVLHSIGYEGHTPESLAGALQKAGVELLVDVRELPMSRKKGFSKTPLSELLAKKGIEYANLRALGAPKEVRHAYKSGGSEEAFRAAYRTHLAQQWSALHELEGMARRRPAAILCRESDPLRCHRVMIGEELAKHGWRVVDLP